MKVIALFILGVMVSFSVLACSPVTTDGGNDILNKELVSVYNELSATRKELQESKSALSVSRAELNATKNKLSESENKTRDDLVKIKALESQLAGAAATQDKYNKLVTDYNKLKAQYDSITASKEETISEKDIENVLFKLVNEERKSSGLTELIWNSGLYSSALNNNRTMAVTKSLQVSEGPSLQQVFWFLGYGTSDKIAGVTLATWKSNPMSYKQNVLNTYVVNGAVAAYKSEDIIYITFMCFTDAPNR